ncbi:MAG TPA: AI-2E family transporter [Thermomicrobiales bacterium]|nr:AI-2E family transporter [Thermomicrobiales bacterium]
MPSKIIQDPRRPRDANRAGELDPTSRGIAEDPPQRIEIDLPWRTIIRVLATIGFLLLVSRLSEVIFQIFLGFLLAAALFPLVLRLERHGVRRGLAVIIVLLGVIGGLVLIIAAVLPSLIQQAADFYNNLPQHARDAFAWLQPREPALYNRIILYVDRQTTGGADVTSVDINVEQAISGGQTVFSILAGVVAAFAVAAFTLTGGDQVLRSLGRLLPEGQEAKVRRMVPEVTRVVSGYVVGQGINSSLFAVFTFVVFTALDLPSPLVAAVIAFILDAIPIVGATLATVIFAVLALTVSTSAALIVIVACLIYQQFENYVTSPRVFGRTLNISPFTSLISVLVGSKLLGIPGVLLGPSVAAMISAVIRVWAEDIEVVTGPSGPRLRETFVDRDEPEDEEALEELIERFDQPEDDAEGPVELTPDRPEKGETA